MDNSIIFAVLVVCILLFIALVFIAAMILLRRRMDRRKAELEEMHKLTISEIEGDIINRKKALHDIVVGGGANPNPLSYMTIEDCGRDIYIRCFSVDALPKKTKFATTFRPVVTFPGVRSIFFIQPEIEDKTKKKLDHHIIVLDGEQSTAAKYRERTRVRSLQTQLDNTETWVNKIEEGYEKFFKVQFLFIMIRDDLKTLNIDSDTFYREARRKGIDITSCFSCHPEAFLSGAPVGRPVGTKLINFKFGAINMDYKAPLKTHYLSRGAVADIFNHISSDFRHKGGVPIGLTMQDLRPVLYDPFSPSHINGYGIIFSGKTGCGKTSLIKALGKRLSNTTDKYRFAVIDSKSRSNRGEYSSFSDDLNGVCHVFRNNSELIINLCEVSERLEFDEVTKTEYRALHLAEAKSVLVTKLLMLTQGIKEDADFVLGTYMNRIFQDIVDECFDELEIYDGQPDSLYTMKNVVDDGGKITQARKKKDLPTISMIYKKAMIHHKKNDEKEHAQAYRIILDSLKDYVRLIAYCETEKGLVFLDPDMVMDMLDEEHELQYTVQNISYPVRIIKGNKNYFDGQSTVEFSRDCVCTDFDISGLPEKDRPIARCVIMLFITEEFIKTNSLSYSADAKSKLVIILEENNENYPYQFMRQCMDNAYRTLRSRGASVWISQQALSDGSQYTEIEQGVLANTAVMFLFKQPEQDVKFLMKHTILNEAQAKLVTKIGIPDNPPEDPDEAYREFQRHIGECCLIDGGKATFMKVELLKATETFLTASNRNTLDELFQQKLSEQHGNL